MKKLIIIFLIAASASMASEDTLRPIIEIPADLTAEYWREAYAQAEAIIRQNAVIEKAKKYCEDNTGVFGQMRNSEGKIILVCTPKETDKK